MTHDRLQEGLHCITCANYLTVLGKCMLLKPIAEIEGKDPDFMHGVSLVPYASPGSSSNCRFKCFSRTIARSTIRTAQ